MFDAAIDHAIESRLADAAAAAEAAILIFRHSVLDYVATELCRVLGTLAPRLWEDALGERRLKLSDVNSFGSYEDALRGLVSTYMDEIERKSLVERLNLVAQKCFPGEPAIPLFASKWGGEFTLDIERLRRVDRARQEIIHGAELQRKSEDFEDDLEYCELTVTYLIKIIGIRFALAIGDGAYPPDECKLTVMCGPSTPPRAQFR